MYLQHCSPHRSSGRSSREGRTSRRVQEPRVDQEIQDFQVALRDPGCQVCPAPGHLGGEEEFVMNMMKNTWRTSCDTTLCGLIYRGVLEVLWGLGLRHPEILSHPSLLVDLETNRTGSETSEEYEAWLWLSVSLLTSFSRLSARSWLSMWAGSPWRSLFSLRPWRSRSPGLSWRSWHCTDGDRWTGCLVQDGVVARHVAWKQVEGWSSRDWTKLDQYVGNKVRIIMEVTDWLWMLTDYMINRLKRKRLERTWSYGSVS